MKQLKVLKDKEFIDNELYHYLKPTDLPAPRFYGQPKIHKPGAHIRLIVSYRGSPLYSLNKYIPKILKVYVKDENSNGKKFQHVFQLHLPIENDGIAVSLDATSLYTSIPIIYTLYVIRDYVNNHDQFTRKTAIPRDEFLT